MRFEYTSATIRNMPYIVTTKRFNDRWSASRNIVSRRAVATLEPDETALRLFGVRLGRHDTLTDEQAEIVSWLAWVGAEGDFSPLSLPDGTVIEVEPVAWFKVAIAADLLPRWQQSADTPWVDKAKTEILDAYNARQS